MGAEAVLPCDTPCPRPLSIVDRWDDANANSAYDVGEYYDPVGTGYGPADIGSALTIRVMNPQDSTLPGGFLPVDFPPLGGQTPPVSGTDALVEHLQGCTELTILPGDSLRIEPGNVVGTFQTVFGEYLADDPDSYWDPDVGEVVEAEYPPGQSPRYLRVTFFHPPTFLSSGKNWVVVAREAIVWLESIEGYHNTVRLVCVDPASPTPVVPVRWGELKTRYR